MDILGQFIISEKKEWAFYSGPDPEDLGFVRASSVFYKPRTPTLISCSCWDFRHFSSSPWWLCNSPVSMKHNNVVPNGHFKKHWQNYVKTWFNQPARKTRRRIARQKKAVKIFPRPTAGPLRPLVHGQTLKYNMKVRAGRGFSLEELKAAGIPKKLAPTIGIAVDHRRKNRSLEGLQANVQRLKTYKAKLVVFPRRARKFKAGDSAPEELATATQVQGEYMAITLDKPSVDLVKITDEMKSFNAYGKLRVERMNERHVGARLKKAAEAEKEEKK